MRLVTVADLLDALGPHLFLEATGDLGASVTCVQTTDPAFPAEVQDGAVVLAAGLAPGSPEVAALLAGAAPAAVVVKSAEPWRAPPPGDAAVLRLVPGADWGTVAELMRTALRAVGTPSEVSLFGVADAVAALCGGPVVMHDSAWALLAYSRDQPGDSVRSETLSGRRAPFQEVEELERLGVLGPIRGGEVVHIPAGTVEGMAERWAAGVVVGRQFLGSIWLLPGERAAADDIAASLARGAEIAALAFLRQATSERTEDGTRDEAFEALLSGGSTARLVAERLGVAPDHGFVLAALEPTGADAAAAATSRRLLRDARIHLDAYRSTVARARDGARGYLLFPAGDDRRRGQVAKVLADLHERTMPVVPHRIVVGARYRSLGETLGERRVVDDLLGIAGRRAWSPWIDGDQVEAPQKLQQFREVALASPGLLQGGVVRVADHDRDQGTDLLETLRQWFEAVGDPNVVAARMELHVNTVRNRIRRAQAVSGLRFDDPDDRLLAELQVRLLLRD